MSSKSLDVGSLFQAAQQEGNLSGQSVQTLGGVPDIGALIQAGLGTPVDDVTASEVVLVTVMPDDSGSIRFVQGNTEAVREGHNMVIDALNASKQADGILMHTRYLNGEVLFPYRPLAQAIPMDSHNYNPDKGTPLYDQTVVLLGTVLAKTQEFADNGVPVRSVTLLVTDGHDEHSARQSAKSVSVLVRDMLMSENHIIAGMGISDGRTDFKQVFSEMGIPDEWILTPGNTPSEIRKAFQVFSQSAVRASQGAASFSQTAIGGFGG